MKESLPDKKKVLAGGDGAARGLLADDRHHCAELAYICGEPIGTECSGMVPRIPKKQKHISMKVFIAALLIVFVVVPWIALSSDPPLLSHATRILPNERFEADNYAWLPSHELLIARGNKLFRCDTRIGTKTELKGIVADGWSPFRVSPSPDGKWLSFFEVRKGWNRARLTKLDGSIKAFDAQFAVPNWMPDSQHILYFGHENDKETASIFDVPRNRVSHAVPMASSTLTTMESYSGWITETSTRLVRIEPDLMLQSARTKSSITIGEYTVETTLHVTHQRLVATPEGTWLVEVKISPEGDRIAWVVRREWMNPLDAWLAKILPSRHVRPLRTQELWVSKIDGRDMRNIGVNRMRDDSLAYEGISDLRWRPDRTSVSFLYKSSLYTVPAR